jgi:hypothetical protein
MRLLILSEVKIFHFQRCNRFSSRCEKFSLLGTKALRLEVEFIDVGLALSTPFDGHPADLLQLLEVGDQTATGDAHILGYKLLAGIAIVVLPRVAQEQGIGELRARRDRVGVEKKIRHHREATRGCGIGIAQTDIAVDNFEMAADVLHGANYSVPPLAGAELSTVSCE